MEVCAHETSLARSRAAGYWTLLEIKMLMFTKRSLTMIITTFPLSFRKKRSFKLFYTPFVADMLGNYLKIPIFLPINQLGIRTDLSPDIVRDYKKNLGDLGIHVPVEAILSDLCPHLNTFVESCVNELVDRGQCYTSERQFKTCDCGVIEVPIEAEQAYLTKVVPHEHVCIVCKTGLRVRKGTVLVIRNTLISSPTFLQANMMGRYMAVQRDIFHKEIIISRLARHTGAYSSYKEFTLDPDFCLGLYPAFLEEVVGHKNNIFVVGMSTLSQVSKVTRFSYLMFPDIRLRFVIHPTVSFPSICTNGMTLSELSSNFISVRNMRMFMGLGLNWSKYESIIPADDYRIVNETKLNSYTEVPEHETELSKALANINRGEILSLMKRVRSRSSLSNNDHLLIRAAFGA
jgi:hypothetical protein